MKVSGSSSSQSASPARPVKGAAAGAGFSVRTGAAAEAAGSARAAGVTGVASLDALLALQSVESSTERRRRAVSRAGRILDALDGLKVALLDGQVSSSSLQALTTAVREERAGADDPRLQGLLNEIETRAAVELAKLGRSAAA